MECQIDVRFFPAPEDLQGCLTTFYRARVTTVDGGQVNDLLQPEWANVRFFSGDAPDAHIPGSDRLNRARFTATGPSTRATHFELGTTRMWGVGLFPLGWSKFCNGPAAEMANRVVDGEAHDAFAGFADIPEILFDGADDDEREYGVILERLRKLDREVAEEGRIRRVHAALVDPQVATVRALTEHAEIGQRMLERLCNRAFGFTPGQLLRRQRFMRSLADFMLEHASNWTEAMDSHYHDQAQFVRDFREFMGMRPREYAARAHPILGAFMKERARIWGTAAQTLDRPD